MWSAARSGSEAHRFSPASTLQREAMFLQVVSADGARAGRAARWAVQIVIAMVPCSFEVACLIQHD